MLECTYYLNKIENYLQADCTNSKQASALITNKHIVAHLQSMAIDAHGSLTRKNSNAGSHTLSK